MFQRGLQELAAGSGRAVAMLGATWLYNIGSSGAVSPFLCLWVFHQYCACIVSRDCTAIPAVPGPWPLPLGPLLFRRQLPSSISQSCALVLIDQALSRQRWAVLWTL